jgi:geranylgeranylglycerol-phosphate geranylgeranyltransferase
MKAISPYLKILRPGNALMAGLTAALGFWISDSRLPGLSLMHMMIAAICAVGYGNVINDVLDVTSDRISHPLRPLPSSEMALVTAIVLAFFLCSFSVVNAFLVSTPHGLGAVAPVALLSLYAFFLKGTPLAGNIVVSLLVAYTIIFGSLSAPLCSRLYIPALLAFLLNFAREIVKDVQDEPGDTAAGVTTTAALPKSVLKALLLALSAMYLGFLFIPLALKQFGLVYGIVCGAIVLPMHGFWSLLVGRKNWVASVARISLFIKLEMLAGLLALAADQACFLLWQAGPHK